jgi:predicted regulator of Ras-like GTPase activity (Roadblock/LC7/MglB family)
MAQKFLTNIDLNQNQIQNASFEVLATDPPTGNFDGRLIYNSTEGVVKVYDSGIPGWRRHVMTVSSAGAHATGLTIVESNGDVTITPNLATSASAGFLSASDFTKLGDATADATAEKLVIRDGNGNTKVATPTDSAHVATKGYVDAARQGLDVKQSVRAATTAAINLASDLNNGDVLDGVTLVTGDRILVKNQVSDSENGIYVATASGAASRSSDANGTVDTGELKPGTFTFVEEGTVNSDKGFVVSTNGTITVGSTGITWAQFSGAGSFEAGDGLSQSGNTINVNVTANRTAITADAIDISANYVGQSSITTLGTVTTGIWNSTDIAVADGGTGASTAADARTNLGIKTSATAATTSVSTLSRIASQTIGDGAAVSYTITHSFNTRDVSVQIYETGSPYSTVIADVSRPTADTIVVTFAVAPALNAYRVVINS